MTWCDHVACLLVLSQVFPVKNQAWKKRVRIEQSQASTWLFLVLFWFYLISHDRPLWFCSSLVTIYIASPLLLRHWLHCYDRLDEECKQKQRACTTHLWMDLDGLGSLSPNVKCFWETKQHNYWMSMVLRYSDVFDCFWINMLFTGLLDEKKCNQLLPFFGGGGWVKCKRADSMLWPEQPVTRSAQTLSCWKSIGQPIGENIPCQEFVVPFFPVVVCAQS